MSRTVVGYIPSGFLNSAASTSPRSDLLDAETGAPIATGLVVGRFQEFSDAEALKYTQPGRRNIADRSQVTAGSGMTPGTYALVIGAPAARWQYRRLGTITVTAHRDHRAMQLHQRWLVATSHLPRISAALAERRLSWRLPSEYSSTAAPTCGCSLTRAVTGSGSRVARRCSGLQTATGYV